MKTIKRPVMLWGLAGVILSLCTLVAIIFGMTSSPALLVDSAAVNATAEYTLGCFRGGDYEALEAQLYGNPDLGTYPEDANTPEGMIWKAYRESLNYQVLGECFPSGNGLALTLRVQHLDIPAVTQSLQDMVPELLEQTAAEKDKTEVYDENRQYREAFLAEVLAAATAQSLSGDQPVTEREITLELLRSEGCWKILPTDTLHQLLSGFTLE